MPDAAEIRQILGEALLDRAGDLPETRRRDARAAISHLELCLATTVPGSPAEVLLVSSLAHAYWLSVDGDATRYDEVDQLVYYARRPCFMASGGDPPREALRLAQIWMLDPRRSAPAEMLPYLAKVSELRRQFHCAQYDTRRNSDGNTA